MRGAPSPTNVRLSVEVVGLNGVLSIDNVSKKEPVMEIFRVVRSLLSDSNSSAGLRIRSNNDDEEVLLRTGHLVPA